MATPSQDNSAAKTPGVVMMVRMKMMMARMSMKMVMIRKILEVGDVGDDEINKYEDSPQDSWATRIPTSRLPSWLTITLLSLN